jgi:hypothetical protein
MVDGVTVLEIKCPYSGRDQTISELVAGGYKHLRYDKDNNLTINTSSRYYSEVQGEMALKKVSHHTTHVHGG